MGTEMRIVMAELWKLCPFDFDSSFCRNFMVGPQATRSVRVSLNPALRGCSSFESCYAALRHQRRPFEGQG